MDRKRGSLFIEVMLAVGILGGAVLCCLGLFTPIISKVQDIEATRSFKDVERKINAFIQMRSFNEIYLASKAGEIFYFYKGIDGGMKVSKSMNEIKESGSIIRAQLSASSMKDIRGYEPEDYPESYFAIWVEIGKLVVGEKVKGKVRAYTVIKNR